MKQQKIIECLTKFYKNNFEIEKNTINCKNIGGGINGNVFNTICHIPSNKHPPRFLNVQTVKCGAY